MEGGGAENFWGQDCLEFPMQVTRQHGMFWFWGCDGLVQRVLGTPFHSVLHEISDPKYPPLPHPWNG